MMGWLIGCSNFEVKTLGDHLANSSRFFLQKGSKRTVQRDPGGRITTARN